MKNGEKNYTNLWQGPLALHRPVVPKLTPAAYTGIRTVMYGCAETDGSIDLLQTSKELYTLGV